MTEILILILLSGFVFTGIVWTAWDLNLDRRRKRR
ncbi:hypothetical protein DFQ14_102447 [Halopolyspora algeriensis]|uniref:Uncharacterized protein n=1 Tax=Halopolyspora algeriensis TaxID=1500506 RepID=A0A368VW87_9ACTN|nr:hypothetical protein DFQ14_102447 [Halopolyspora algeriensis]TQM55548.1 hypothetical protein FHU43_0322 [Halopolyspora algeriensis]